jgi:hypothetical protein
MPVDLTLQAVLLLAPFASELVEEKRRKSSGGKSCILPESSYGCKVLMIKE